MKKNTRGFTLIELIIVIAIMAIVYGMVNSGFEITSSGMEIDVANSTFKQTLNRASRIAKAVNAEHKIQIKEGKVEIVNSDLVVLETITLSKNIIYKLYINSVETDEIVINESGYIEKNEDDIIIVAIYYKSHLEEKFSINKYMVMVKEVW